MIDENRRRVCTVDHAGKQRDAIGWSDHDFWLTVVRRRKAAMTRLPEGRDAAAVRSGARGR